jgi:zinc/manganese transport system substrate-binding protein
VTNHDALGYFADRYGFEVLGSVIPAPSTLAQTSPAQLEELAKTVEQAGVPTIFSEAQHSDADVQALAQRVGNVDVATLFTGSLGEPDSGAETYTGLVRANAKIIAVGLS